MGHITQRVEFPVVDSMLGVAHNSSWSYNPHRLDPDFGGRLVVMELTLRSLQDLTLVNPQLGLYCLQHVFEIAQVRLVRAHVLRGDDAIELDALQTPRVRLGE